MRLVDAGFIWTEPHSKRIKAKLTIQKEVPDSYIMPQKNFLCVSGTAHVIFITMHKKFEFVLAVIDTIFFGDWLLHMPNIKIFPEISLLHHLYKHFIKKINK